MDTFVPKEDYDKLKAKYDRLKNRAEKLLALYPYDNVAYEKTEKIAWAAKMLRGEVE